MFILYGFLLFVATYNTYCFVFGSNRYQNFHITYFYVLVYLVVILRLLWLSLILYVINNDSQYLGQVKDKKHGGTMPGLEPGVMKQAIF